MPTFHQLLTEAIRNIGRQEGKKIGQIQDELGITLGKKGRHSIEHWRKEGNKPYKISDLEKLAEALVKRQGILTVEVVEQFLRLGDHPQSELRARLLFQSATLNTEPPMDNLASEPDTQRLTQHLPIPTYEKLFGVAHYVERLHHHLQNSHHHIISVSGLGGIGKTALTDYAIRTFITKPNPFTEVLWVSAKQDYLTDFGIARNKTQINLADLFDDLGRQLAEPEIWRLSLPEKIHALAKRLRRHPHLVVIDNLETIADYQMLIPYLEQLANPTKFLLTSRQIIPALTTISPVQLKELARPDSIALIEDIAQRKNVTYIDAEAIFDLVGGNPLALILLVSQMQYLPATEVLKRVQLGSNEDIYTYVYKKSWSVLTHTARRILFTIQRAGGEVDWQWLVTMLKETDEHIDVALHHLIKLSLVQLQRTSDNRPCYRIHRLTATFLQTEILGWK